MRVSTMVAVAALLLAGCGGQVDIPAEDELETKAEALAQDRSFAVVHEKFLRRFPLERVLKQLVSLAGIPGVTHLDLFQQMWDAQNPRPGLSGGSGPFCDDHITWQGDPGLNEFKWECPRLEGFQAAVDPFGPDPLYIPIGLFNRFDLAPTNGAHCGEYRIVYGMQREHPLAQEGKRNFIIFEGILPNPTPQKGLEGCLPIAQMWADFTFMSDLDMAKALDRFYFQGVHGFDPVVHPRNYGLLLDSSGACSTGQIRTNQFNTGPWTMREYKLTVDCRCKSCDLRMIPLTVKSNPFPDLFKAATPEPLAPLLQATLASHIADLSVDNVNTISYRVDDSLLAAESRIDDPQEKSDYLDVATGNAALHAAIHAALPTNSTLTSSNIIDRALTQSCAGCHFHSDGRDLGDGLTWPHSLSFTHTSEFIQPNGTYPISLALTQTFIPYRAKILVSYLADPGGFGTGGGSCRLELPPEFRVDDLLCRKAEQRPGSLAKTIKSGPARALREKWEGKTILGRRSGH